MVAVRVREAQLSGVGVLRANVQRDMCVVWKGPREDDATFRTLDRRQEPRVSATRRVVESRE